MGIQTTDHLAGLPWVPRDDLMGTFPKRKPSSTSSCSGLVSRRVPAPGLEWESGRKKPRTPFSLPLGLSFSLDPTTVEASWSLA